MELSNACGIHAQCPLRVTGSLETAEIVFICIHGRNATYESLLEHAQDIFQESGLKKRSVFICPTAQDKSWYPKGAFVEVSQNEPNLSCALQVIHEIVQQVLAKGISSENIYLIGFSQGACLVAEYAARNSFSCGGIGIFCGALIGKTTNKYSAEKKLKDTPVYLGCGDTDEWIPKERVEEAAQQFKDLGANVSSNLFPGMKHTITKEEKLQFVDLCFKS